MFRTAALLSLTACLAAQGPESVLQRLPANTTNLLVVRDVLPHVEAVLDSSALADLLTATRELQQEAFGMHFEAATLKQQIGLFERFIPREFGIAAPASIAGVAVDGLRAFAAGALLHGMSADERQEEAAVELATSMANDLAAIDRLDLAVWVVVRDERTAEGWFDSIERWLRSRPAPDGIELSFHDGSLTAKVQPARIDGGALRRELASMGVTLDAAWDPTFTATLTQSGPVLSLRLGQMAAPPLPARELGRLWSEDASALGFLRTDCGDQGDRLIELGDQLQPFVESEHAETSATAARLLTQLGSLYDRAGQWSGVLRIDHGVQVLVEQDFGDDVLDQIEAPASQVVRCLAPADGPFALFALPLDLVIANNLDEVAAQAASRGIDLSVPADIVDFFEGGDSAVFQSGTLWLTRAAEFRGGADWQHGPMPFAAGALVGKVVDEQSANDFMARLAGLINDAIGHDGPLWTEQDLGFGVATHGLDLAQLAPGLTALHLDCDFAPHWFVIDDVLVVSTDKKFSADLVARMRGERSPELPAGQLISWARCSGSQWTSVLDGARRWAEVLPVPERFAGPLQLTLRALAAFGTTFEAIESREELDGTVYRDSTTLRLKTGK